MGRYRPPQAPSSPYITPAGYEALQQELKGLWPRRAEVTQALSAAAAEGDRSENAEYIYRKKELREIDRRIRYLQKRLPALQVVGAPPADRNRVYFGAWVRLEEDNGETRVYRIVGADELHARGGHISLDSPLARALLKKTLDEKVTVHTPSGERVYYIAEIRYDAAL